MAGWYSSSTNTIRRKQWRVSTSRIRRHSYLECDGPNVLRVLSRDLTNKLHRYEFLDLRYMGIDRDTTVRMREALLELLKINPTMPT